MIKSYSKKTSASQQLSANFKVQEFACKDGSDTVLIDDNLVDLLQKIRNWANASISISSAYRTVPYNAKIGGEPGSYHTKGQAADITVGGKIPQNVAKYAESIGVRGIGLYNGTAGHFTHVDTRTVRYLWVNTNGKNVGVSTHGGAAPDSSAAPAASASPSSGNPYTVPAGNLKKGSKGDGVKWIQWSLKQKGYSLALDGDFGTNTDTSVRDFQKKSGLTIDGVVGKKTLEKLS